MTGADPDDVAPAAPTPEQLPLRIMDRQYAGIQYMRGFAAVAVLLTHAFMDYVWPVKAFGLVLSLFFLISGFLVISITTGRSRPHRFMLARIRRIGPLYWLVTMAAATLLWGGVSWHSPIPFWHVFSYDPPMPLRLVAASLGFIPYWNPGTGTIMPVNPAGWTVNLEMFYYALFALLLFLPRRWLMTALTLAVGTLVLTGIFARPDHPVLWTWTHPMGLEFLIGAWVGHAWQNNKSMWRALGWCTIAVVTLYLAQVAVLGFSWLGIQMLFGPLFGACFVAVVSADSRGAGIKVRRLPMLVGNASYAIYLIQFVVMLSLDMAGMPHGLLFGVALLVLSLLAGIAVHLWIDEPVMRLLGRKALKPAG